MNFSKFFSKKKRKKNKLHIATANELKIKQNCKRERPLDGASFLLSGHFPSLRAR